MQSAEDLVDASNLAGLSNHELIAKLKSWAAKERRVTLGVLFLLNEVERRKLHLDKYSSLFAYCTDRLGYSNSAAGRRIAAARCLRSFPAVVPMLLDGRLNLTTLCILARVLTEQNVADLLARAAGASQESAELLAAEFGAPKPARDRIKPVKSPQRGYRTADSGEVDTDHAPSQDRRASGGDSACGDAAGSASGSCTESAMYDVTFRADGELVEKLRRAQALLSSVQANPSLAFVVGRALESLLDRHDPERREARRQTRQSLRKQTDTTKNPEARTDQPRPGAERRNEVRAREDLTDASNGGPQDATTRPSSEMPSASNDPATAVDAKTIIAANVANSGREGIGHTADGDEGSVDSASAEAERSPARRRFISQQVRDRVFLLFGMHCAFVGSEGRCPETRNLDLDHIVPLARGGSDDSTNFRPLCARHNQRLADRVFGSAFMERKRSRTPAPGVRCPKGWPGSPTPGVAPARTVVATSDDGVIPRDSQ